MLQNQYAWPVEFEPIFWGKFRDDIYIPWIHGIAKLREFYAWLNEQLPGISFTMLEPSEHGTDFFC